MPPYNCVDRHCNGPNKNKAAIIWEGEPGDRRVLRYQDLQREVSKFANVLKGLGVQKGDVVAVYMPLIPELVIALLACAQWIGRTSHRDLRRFPAMRVSTVRTDSRLPSAKSLLTADGGYRRGKRRPRSRKTPMPPRPCVPLSSTWSSTDGPESRSTGRPGRDHWWHELEANASSHCPPEGRSTANILSTSSTPRDRRASPRAFSTPPGATWSARP